MKTSTAIASPIQEKPTVRWILWALWVRRNGFFGFEAAVGGHPLRPLNNDEDLLKLLPWWARWMGP